MRKGYRGLLQDPDDLCHLPINLQVEYVEQRFAKSSQQRQKFSLIKTLLSAFGPYYFLLGLIRFIGKMFDFVRSTCVPTIRHIVNNYHDPPYAKMIFCL